MNEAMKLDNIKVFTQDRNIKLIKEKNFIFGSIEPAFWKYMVFRAAAALDRKNFLIFFSKKEVILLRISGLGKFTEDISYLAYRDITDFKYKHGLLQSKLAFKHCGKKTVITIPHFILITKWHKINLTYLKGKNFFRT